MANPPRILVTALNWGLGHAARSLPVIEALERRGAVLRLASDGDALALWRAERPDLPTLDLPSYRISYRTGSMVRNFIPQLPHLVRTVRAEHARLTEYQRTYAFDAVVSDNRYGCYLPGVPSIFLTHQLRIRMPAPWPSAPANWVNHYLIRRFSQCWVPDLPEAPGLAGALAHGPGLPPAVYLGPLSRFPALPSKKQYAWVAVLSGPEPQRSYLEQAIRRQVDRLPGPGLVIGGLPRELVSENWSDRVTYRSFLPGAELAAVLAAAGVVICRSGYSTLMDLARLGSKVLLVPTPGQTEQEYLARSLARQGRAVVQTQEDLDLAQGIKAARALPGLPQSPDNAHLLDRAIDGLWAQMEARGRLAE